MKSSFLLRLGGILIGFLLLPIGVTQLHAQRIAVKTNALELATLTPNLGFELALTRKTSLEFSMAYNPLSTNKLSTEYLRIQPEFRYWFARPMTQHFLGITALYVDNNFLYKNRVIRGDLLGAGITYGYAWILGQRWNLEATAGFGALKYRQFSYNKTEGSAPKEPNKRGILPAPIKLGLTISYILR